jgi:hypothetical protein
MIQRLGTRIGKWLKKKEKKEAKYYYNIISIENRRTINCYKNGSYFCSYQITTTMYPLSESDMKENQKLFTQFENLVKLLRP